MAQQCYNGFLLCQQTLHLTVDPVNNLYTTLEVLGCNHLLQKQLLHTDLALILHFLGIQIKLDSLCSDMISYNLVLNLALDQLHSGCFSFLILRIEEMKLKRSAVIFQLIKYVACQLALFLR